MMNYDRTKLDPLNELYRIQTLINAIETLVENDDLTWDMTVNLTGRNLRLSIVYDQLQKKIETYRKQLRNDIVTGNLYVAL